MIYVNNQYAFIQLKSMSFFKKNKKDQDREPSNRSGIDLDKEKMFLDCLYQLNCCPEKRKGEKGELLYDFKYQGKFFIASFDKKKSNLCITYPQLYVTSVDNLNVVRHICNYFNGGVKFHRLFYGIDERAFSVIVHCDVIFVTDVVVEELVNCLDSCFSMQKDFSLLVDKEINENKGGYYRDFEYQQALSAREVSIAREAEIKHQQVDDISLRSNADFAFTIGDFMVCACGVSPATKYKSLRVIIDNDLKFFDDDETIRTLPIYMPIIEEDTEEFDELEGIKVNFSAHFSAQQAVMIVDYCEPGQEPESLTINLMAKGEDEASFYYRAYAMLPPDDVGRTSALSTRTRAQEAQSSSISLMLAYDKVDEKKKLQEFNFMWQDFKDKLRNGDESLNDNEIIMAQLTNGHVGLNYYWGIRCFAKGHYAQALKHFINAFNVAKYESITMVKDALETMGFYIGFCLCELGKYDRAYYYLELSRNSNNIEHLQELVNSLANAGDLRVFYYIDNYLKLVEQNFVDEQELPENIARFVSFMRRRRAYSLINFGKLDEAEKEFKALLDDPDSNDYALHELAYIQRLRNANSESSKDGDHDKTPS